MADRATLLHLLVWYKPLQGYLLMWRQQLDSRAWVAKRTAEVLDRGAQDVPGGFVDVEEVGGMGCMSSCRPLSFPVKSLLDASPPPPSPLMCLTPCPVLHISADNDRQVRRTARIQRKYFKTMRFHPIILRLSYARTPASNVSLWMDPCGPTAV